MKSYLPLFIVCVLARLVHATRSSQWPIPIPLLKSMLHNVLPKEHSSELAKRVPLMTEDTVAVPLVSAQVHQPPLFGMEGECTIELLRHDFGSFDPAVVEYAPPACALEGKVGSISGNLTVYSNGTQYDRLSSLYLSNVEIWRHSSAEPTKTGTVWTTFKDLSPFHSLFLVPGKLIMEFDNIISAELLLDGVLQVTLSVTFHPPASISTNFTPADLILPLSTLSTTSANYFSISDSYAGGSTLHTLPNGTHIKGIYAEVFASGNGLEEFWYSNTPDQFTDAFPPDVGLVGKGPFREVQLLIDGMVAGVIWPFAVIYTGGITPTNWRPITSYGAYNQPSYFIDLTPFIPLLTDSRPHNFTLTVFGQGLEPVNSINANWFVSGNLQLLLSSRPLQRGRFISHSASPFTNVTTSGSFQGGNLDTDVRAKRKISIRSLVDIGRGKGLEEVEWKQELEYVNVATISGGGWIQVLKQHTSGVSQTVVGTRNDVLFKDQIDFPIQVFSNYTLFEATVEGGYESAINNTFTRSLLTPFLASYTIHSREESRGTVGMDDWPGLRHAVNGTGETKVEFAYSDAVGQTYFRKSSAKNDAWTSDRVEGTLARWNPSVGMDQIRPGGGAGFKRSLGRRKRFRDET